MDKIVKKIGISLLFLLLFFAAELKAEAISIPVKSADSKEIKMEVFDIAGSSMTDTGKEINYSLGEPGGITTLSAGDAELEAGYPFCDFISPAAITDLTGLCNSETGDVTLSWSTPGDDGWTNTLPSGSEYRIDYSTYSKQWSKDTYEVSIPTSGVTPYTEVSRKITGLTGDTTWYFQIWTRDEVPNWSGLSNGATVWVCPIIGVSISTDTYDFGEVPLGNSTHTVSIIIVTNDGNITEDFGLSCATTTPGGSPWYPGLVGESSDYYNRFILRGVFNATEVATDDFGPEDTIEANIRWSQTTSTFTVTGSYTGVNVEADDNRNIWFRLDLPTTSGTSKDQQITATITGRKHE